MEATEAVAVTLRLLIVATRRSPAVVAAGGRADNVALPVGLAAPNDCTTPSPALAVTVCHTGVMTARTTISPRTGNAANWTGPRRHLRCFFRIRLPPTGRERVGYGTNWVSKATSSKATSHVWAEASPICISPIGADPTD